MATFEVRGALRVSDTDRQRLREARRISSQAEAQRDQPANQSDVNGPRRSRKAAAPVAGRRGS